MKRVLCIATLALAPVVISVSTNAQTGLPPAKMAGREKITGKAAMACNYERDLWLGQKYDLIPNYLIPNYTVHHSNEEDLVGVPAWKGWSEKHPAPAQISRDGCPGAERIIESDDMVIFMRHSKVPDPKDPSKMINRLHTDIWRFENGKIAEHWN